MISLQALTPTLCCKKASGFSLVELLVVLLIVGLGINLITVNVGGSDGQQLKLEAKQFANNTALIAEEAVLSNRQWGVDIYRQVDEDGIEQLGYRWLVRNDDGEWRLAVDDHRPVDFLFSPNVNLRLTLEGSDEFIEILTKREIDEESSRLLVEPEEEEKQSIIEALEAGNPKDPIRPALWLLSSGEISAFEMELFILDDPENKAVVVGDELGRIVLKTPEHENDE